MSHKTSHKWLLIILAGLTMSLMIWTVTAGPLSTRAQVINKFPILGKCTGFEEEIFEYDASSITSTNDPVDIWKERYEFTVDSVIFELLDDDNFNPQCDAPTMAQFLEPPPTMRLVAENLPPWKDSTDLNELSRMDVGPVLLELLRSYECALVEREMFLVSEIPTDYADKAFALTGQESVVLRWSKLFREYDDQRGKIAKNVRVSRASMHRVLSLIAGIERFKILRAEQICLQRASLDIRNGLSLGAEAASCLPRTLNSHDVLRDYDERQ